MEKISFNHTPFAGRIAHDRIEQYHIDALEFITDMYSPTQKMALLNISYNDLVQATQDYTEHFSTQLRDVLKKKLVDEAYGGPFNLMDCLDFLELEYKSSITFKRLLANGKIPVEQIVQVLEHIETDFRIKTT